MSVLSNTSATDDQSAAWQEALAHEHEAVHLLGLLGARTEAGTALATQLVDAYTAHRARRDHASRVLRGRGADPVAAAPAYSAPGPLETPVQLRAVAADLERRSQTVYASLVARTVEGDRVAAVGALVESAVREIALGGNPVAFPGAEDLTNR